jgi:flavin prenyltransferase
MQKKIIVAISGASGAIYGKKMLEMLSFVGVETHLIISKAAIITIKQELDLQPKDIEQLADYSYHVHDIAASIASGSYKTDGMIIAPCSIKTMSAIANSVSSCLISRSADVILKERRKLVLMLRETPLHLGHINNMRILAEMGAIIAPPVPAFYIKPKTIDDIVIHSVARVLDLFDIDAGNVKRWQGINSQSE